jgi:hypothetical protein
VGTRLINPFYEGYMLEIINSEGIAGKIKFCQLGFLTQIAILDPTDPWKDLVLSS